MHKRIHTACFLYPAGDADGDIQYIALYLCKLSSDGPGSVQKKNN